MHEMLSVACSAGLSVTFGVPIGGVLFSYEVSANAGSI
jgi:chloride channel 3/4/5